MISAFACFIKGNWELMDLMEIPLYVFNRSLPEIDENPTLGGRIFVDFWEAPVGNVTGNWGRVDRSTGRGHSASKKKSSHDPACPAAAKKNPAQPLGGGRGEKKSGTEPGRRRSRPGRHDLICFSTKNPAARFFARIPEPCFMRILV